MAGLFAEAPRFFSYYNMIFLGEAFLFTALLSFVGCGIGFLAGFGLAVLRSDRVAGLVPLRWLATVYVELFRRVPFLIMLMVVFFTFH